MNNDIQKEIAKLEEKLKVTPEKSPYREIIQKKLEQLKANDIKK